MTRHMSYVACCDDPNIFGSWFSGDSWKTWRVIDKAIFGLPMTAAELVTFTSLTGLTVAPTAPCKEAWLIFGRRGGKDVKAASYAVWLATIGAEVYGWRSRLTRGERGVVQLLAVDRDQAKVCFEYTKAFFEMPMLAKMVKRITANSIELTNNLTIEITTNDKRRVRGRTVVAAIFDEVAHWRNEASANPDEDVYSAIQPATLTIPNALMIGISSPYARRGLLWRKCDAHYGKPGPVLVAKAPTWVMNPTVSREHEMIARKYEEDPADASAEYGAEFRSDLEAYVGIEAVRACIETGVLEKPFDTKHTYIAFVDPSGGSNDSMTMAIAHRENQTNVLDVIRERKPPFSPESVVAEFAALMQKYRCSSCYGDKYGGEWVAEAFRTAHVNYEAAEKPKSALYIDLLPMINSRGVVLLDNDRMLRQLVGLERQTSRIGKDTVDHMRGGHDDVANAVAGALALSSRGPYVSAEQRAEQTRKIEAAMSRFVRSFV